MAVISTSPSNTERMVVRAATLDDRPAIFDFIRNAYGDRAQYKIPERWTWQYKDNPFAVDNDQLPIWIAMDGDKVVGQTCAQIEPFKIGDSISRVGWSVDTMVLPEYRGRGLGGRLQKANQDSHPVFMSIGMSEANRRIKERIGGKSLAPVSVFRKRFGVAANAFEQRIKPRQFQSIATRLRVSDGIERLTRRHYRKKWLRSTERVRKTLDELQFEKIDSFDDDYTEFWNRSSGEMDFAVQRSAEYLNWKFREQPFCNHQRFLIRRSGDICGHIVVRNCASPEPEYGIIADIYVEPLTKEALESVVVFGVDYLLSDGAIAIKTATNFPQMADAFESLGFTRGEARTPMIHVRDRAASLTLERGFFCYGDHDLDQFPLAGRR